MDKINNIIYYLLILLLLGFSAYFFHSYYMALATGLLVLLPFISLLLLRLTKGKITFKVGDSPGLCKRNEEYPFKVTLVNKSLVPVINCDFRLIISNTFAEGKEQTMYISTSVPAFGKRTVTISLKPNTCGRVLINMGQLAVRDMLCFATQKDSACATYSFSVMPRRKKAEGINTATESVADESERPHKDSAGMEIIDLREYMPGDSLKTIHWKLSAKKDDIFVKERGDNTSDMPILLFELDKQQLNQIMDGVYAIARQYIKKGIGLKIGWAGRGDEQLQQAVLNEESGLYPFFERVYLSYCTNEAGHTLAVAKRQLSGGRVLYIDNEEGVKVVSL